MPKPKSQVSRLVTDNLLVHYIVTTAKFTHSRIVMKPLNQSNLEMLATAFSLLLDGIENKIM